MSARMDRMDRWMGYLGLFLIGGVSWLADRFGASPAAAPRGRVRREPRPVAARPRATRHATAAVMALALLLAPAAARADETCQSPYMPKITGEEEYVYVWTLGVDGLGDGSDKLVTVDVRKSSPTYGQVIHSVPVGGRHEAHHADFTDDRRHLWASGLDTSQIFVFDVHTDPAKPRLVKTIDDFVQASGGVVGPHGFYALPGRMLVGGLSNAKDKTGRTAIVEYTNEGHHVTTHWMPTDADPRGAVIEKIADGYGYDARVLPRKNVMFTTSFTGWSNYMTDLGRC